MTTQTDLSVRDEVGLVDFLADAVRLNGLDNVWTQALEDSARLDRSAMAAASDVGKRMLAAIDRIRDGALWLESNADQLGPMIHIASTRLPDSTRRRLVGKDGPKQVAVRIRKTALGLSEATQGAIDDVANKVDALGHGAQTPGDLPNVFKCRLLEAMLWSACSVTGTNVDPLAILDALDALGCN